MALLLRASSAACGGAGSRPSLWAALPLLLYSPAGRVMGCLQRRAQVRVQQRWNMLLADSCPRPACRAASGYPDSTPPTCSMPPFPLGGGGGGAEGGAPNLTCPEPGAWSSLFEMPWVTCRENRTQAREQGRLAAGPCFVRGPVACSKKGHACVALRCVRAYGVPAGGDGGCVREGLAHRPFI